MHIIILREVGLARILSSANGKRRPCPKCGFSVGYHRAH